MYVDAEIFVEDTFVADTLEASMFVDETFVEETLFANTMPEPVTRNCVDELTCRLMKSPLNPVAGFEPMNVPVVFESCMVFGPSWKSCELVDEGGLPPRRRARPERDDWIYPVARIFVDETDARDDWPVVRNEPP